MTRGWLLPWVLLAGGCGLEGLFFVRDFEATPPPRAIIKGRVGSLPEVLNARLGGTTLKARAVAVDGRVLATTDARPGQDFFLTLEPSVGDQFNVRILVGAGSVQLRTHAPEVPDASDGKDRETNVGELTLASTAAQVLLESYASKARSGLAGTPPGVSGKVMQNGQDLTKAEVAAFQALVAQLLDVMDPTRGVVPFAEGSAEPSDTILAAAMVTRAAFDAALAAAVSVVGVPVVCDPSRLRVMFTVDISGQALDGNGKKQFIRQLPKEGRVFLGIALDPSSPIPDAARTLKPRLTPNDVDTEMYDDATRGDEVAGDLVFTTLLTLPRGMRVIYKFTDGSPGEGYTGTEEWPGNARILQVEDVITGDPTGKPDCLVIRRDSFGDESSNKNFVNLHSTLGGGAMQFSTDVGGPVVPAAMGEGLLPVGGLAVDALSTTAPLTPAGIPEARENGQCIACPPPVTVPVDDNTPPSVVTARFASPESISVLFSEDLDLGTAADLGNYLVTDDGNVAVAIRRVEVSGALVVLSVDPTDVRRAYRLFVARVADASLQRNVVRENANGYPVQKDTVAPILVSAEASTITEVNPSARPQNPLQGEVVSLLFSELLDRISAENVLGYRIEGPGGELPVHAAFQRGRRVLLVTDSLQGGAEHTVSVSGVFDLGGNLVGPESAVPFKGLSLHRVTLRVVPGHAWASVDGALRGLPPGEDLYVTGTITQAARAADGADIRVLGRPDVAGMQGFQLVPSATEANVGGKPVFTLDLLLPTGTYAFKFAHGTQRDAIDPPATLETVSKALCTANNPAGVQVNPVTMVGEDNLSYATARLSLGGDDAAASGVLFKRENPDAVVNVSDADVLTPVYVLGTWRDVPFGRGRDYDDGKRELPLLEHGVVDTRGPLPIAAEARDSESVTLSFNKAIRTAPAELTVSVTDEEGIPLPASVLLAGELKPTQAVLRTGPMALNRGYTVLVSRAVDAAGNVSTDMRTVAFTSPGSFVSFTPVVDREAPAVVQVLPTGPTTLLVRFSERVAPTSAETARYAISLVAGGSGPMVSAARISDAGRSVVLTTTAQEANAAYSLRVTNVSDQAATPNVLQQQDIAFAGFGDLDAPELVWARAISPTQVALRFNEALDASSASAAVNYVIISSGAGGVGGGVAVQGALSSNAEAVALGAFNGTWAPLRQDLVVLTLAEPIQAARAYTVTASNVLDVSGNASSTNADFMGVTSSPTVTVELRYLISATAQVVGVGPGGSAAVPARALTGARLATEREGVFALGTALTETGATALPNHPFTSALNGFPPEGSPLEGVEPRLQDDGASGDGAAGDGVFGLRITGVPLGSVVSWKSFASYSVAYRTASMDPLAAFADAAAGPFSFSDGQEFPGNDNAAWIVADEDGNGTVVLDNLYGDEITFKRKTGFRPFAWVTDAWRRQE